MCYVNNSGSNLLSSKIVFMYFKSQPRFHARISTSHFTSTLVAVGASYKIADNIFYVPQSPLNTSGKVACFFHKNPTELYFLTYAPRLRRR